MTILGNHTVDETEHIMKLMEFRIQAVDKLNNQITQAQVATNPAMLADLENDWTNFRFRWATAREKVANDLLFILLGQPLVPASVLAAEPQYQQIMHAISVNGDGTKVKGDFGNIVDRFQAFTGQHIDEADQPLPTGFDPDLLAYKKVDDAIKSGEAAAAAAAQGVSGAVSSSVKNNLGTYAVLGAVAVVGGIVAVKVYL